MNERREAGGAKRQCSRFGCSALATATFTFDSETCTVWLDAIDDSARTGGVAAGELCSRHARLLRPPRDWQLDDRRSGAASPEVDAPPSEVAAPKPPAAPSRVALEVELRDLLDAQSPLLARAFRSSGTV